MNASVIFIAFNIYMRQSQNEHTSFQKEKLGKEDKRLTASTGTELRYYKCMQISLSSSDVQGCGNVSNAQLNGIQFLKISLYSTWI